MTDSLAHQNTRYEVILHEDDNGDLILPIPLNVMREMGWNENDHLECGVDREGLLYLKKAHK